MSQGKLAHPELVPEHWMGLEGAKTIQTAAFIRVQNAVNDVVRSEKPRMAAIHGESSLGKTFAVASAAARQPVETWVLEVPVHPSIKDVIALVLRELTGVEPAGTRMKLTRDLADVLVEKRRLIVLDEAQRLSHGPIEALRALWDHRETRFALVFCGGHGCYRVLKTYPMLRRRISRWVEFEPLKPHDVEQIMRSYHPIYEEADTQVLLMVDEGVGRGVFREWAEFTVNAVDVCAGRGLKTIDEDSVREVIARKYGGHAA